MALYTLEKTTLSQIIYTAVQDWYGLNMYIIYAVALTTMYTYSSRTGIGSGTSLSLSAFHM